MSRADPTAPDPPCPSVQSELLQLNRPQQPLPVPRNGCASRPMTSMRWSFWPLFRAPVTASPSIPGWRVPSRWELKDVTLQEALATVGDMRARLRRAAKGQCLPRLSGRSAHRDHTGQLPDDGSPRLSRTSVSTGGVTANDNNNNGNNNNVDNGLNNGGNNNFDSSSNGDSNANGNGTRIETDSNNDYWTDLRDSLQTPDRQRRGESRHHQSPGGSGHGAGLSEGAEGGARVPGSGSGEHLKRQVVLGGADPGGLPQRGLRAEVDWSGLSASWDGGKGHHGGGSLLDSPIANTPTRSSGALGAVLASPFPMATSTWRSACSKTQGT